MITHKHSLPQITTMNYRQDSFVIAGARSNEGWDG